MDQNTPQDCSPEAVVQVLRDQARSLRTIGTGLFQRADELDGIGDQWESALSEQSGLAGDDPSQQNPPTSPGMRGGGPRRR
jgi:hypothetical protein